MVANDTSRFSPIKDMAGDRTDKPGIMETDAPLNYRRHFRIRPLAEVERDAIEQAVDACQGNITKAAALLNVAPSTIYRKRAQWDQKDE